MEYWKVFNNIVDKTCKYLQDAGLESMILGISGGLDSTVVAAIGKEVFNRTGIKLIGISMPTSTNKLDETISADLALEAFCNEAKNFSISFAYQMIQDYADSLNGNKSTNISRGNIKARLRMIFLYDLASVNNGLVLDTDNMTEHNLGFWTIHGDVGDFNPIGGLWKGEVYKLAEWIRDNQYKKDSIEYSALDKAIKLTPTDGNGVAEGGDMVQIAPGKTYEDVDKILKFVTNNPYRHPQAVDDFIYKQLNGDFETYDRVLKRHLNSAFKRKQLPIKISREDTFNMENSCLKFEIVDYIDDFGKKQYHVYRHNQHKYIKSELVEFNIYKLKDDDSVIITRETDVSFDDSETVENVVREFIKYQNDKNVILTWSKEQKRILYIPQTNIEQSLNNVNILKNINFVYYDYNSALEQDKKLSNS